jgi:hypothetical protein
MTPLTRHRMRRPRLAAGLLLVGMALSACGPDTDSTIGMRATALDLQFARPDLAVPVPPKIIVRLLPAPPASLQHIINPGTPLPPPLPPTPPPPGCPPATAPGTPGKPLAASTLGAPTAGYYSYATKGKGTVSSGSDSTTAPVPSVTDVAVSGSQQEPPTATIDVEGGTPPSGTETQYTVTTRLSPTVQQVDTLMVSATSINLAKRQLTNAERTFDFVPTPQVRLMVFGAVGSSWSSRGTDSNSSATMDYAGTIEAVTDVKICGVVTKAYRVSYSSTLTNNAGYEVIRTGTDSAHPATFTIAPQLGGLILAQKVYSEDVRLYSDLSGYIGTTLDYTSVLTDLVPATVASTS